MKHVVLVAMQKSHGTMFGLVAKALVACEEHLRITVVSGDLWHGYDAETALNALNVAFVRLPRPQPGPSLHEQFDALSILRLQHAARPIVKAFLKEANSDLVVVGSDHWGIEQFFIQCASAWGIPTLLVQDGALDEAPEAQIYDIGHYEYGCGGATRFAMTGTFDQQRLLKQGIAPHKITITGQPRFDLLKSVPQGFSENDAAGIILFATQPVAAFQSRGVEVSLTSDELAVQVISAALPYLQKRQMMIKLHPSENLESYSKTIKLANQTFPAISVIRDADIVSLLHRSAVVITLTSTVAQEAILVGKPIISLTYVLPGYKSYLTGSRAVLEVHESQSLPSAIQAALADDDVRRCLAEGREEFVAQRLHRADGHSAERIAELILHLLDTANLHAEATLSHVVAAYWFEEALDAFESHDETTGYANLLAVLRHAGQLEQHPDLLGDGIMRRAYTIGDGRHAQSESLVFASHVEHALYRSKHPTLRHVRRHVANAEWAAARELLSRNQLKAMRHWLRAATINPGLLCTHGFLSCGIQSIIGQRYYQSVRHLLCRSPLSKG